MFERLLSIAGPLWAYISLAVLGYGLWKQRAKLDWLALVPALAGLAASVILLSPVHRLFFDEDIYINIAGNLAHAPVNQVTVMGGPGEVQVSSYYKEPAGWPVLLSLVFLLTGASEAVAFWVARALFAIAIAAVFHLAREALESRRPALIAALLFGATPVCYWFSVSAGTDIPAALFAVAGMWGLIAGNGALAAGGFALAAQTRMELLILAPVIWLSSRISSQWKIRAAFLVAIEIAHVAWVMSVAPLLEQVERIPATFSLRYTITNLRDNLVYLLDPYTFFGAILLLALVLSLYRRGARPQLRLSGAGLLALQALALFCVYLFFYAGSFEMNPRYSIQLLAPLSVIAAALMQGRRAVLLLVMILPYMRPLESPSYVQTLAAEHRIAQEFAAQVNSNDLVVSGQAEMFLNQGRRAMNAIYASRHKEKLNEELRRRKVWYHSGVRTNVPDSQDSLADRWVKSNFDLHLVRSQQIGGMQIAFYELLLKDVDREARLVGSFDGKSNSGERR